MAAAARLVRRPADTYWGVAAHPALHGIAVAVGGVGTFGGKGGDPAHRPDVCVGGAALRRPVARRLLRAVVRPLQAARARFRRGGAAARRPGAARRRRRDPKLGALEDLRRERLPEPEGVLQGQAHRPSRLRRAARRRGHGRLGAADARGARRRGRGASAASAPRSSSGAASRKRARSAPSPSCRTSSTRAPPAARRTSTR